MVLITSLNSAITQPSEPFMFFFFFFFKLNILRSFNFFHMPWLQEHPPVQWLLPGDSSSLLTGSFALLGVHCVCMCLAQYQHRWYNADNNAGNHCPGWKAGADSLLQGCVVGALLINPNWEIRAISMNTWKMSPIRLAGTEEKGCRKESEPKEM